MPRRLGGVMNRRGALQGIATALLAACWPARVLAGGLGFAWDRKPAIAVLGAAYDPRQELVRDAVAFWNPNLQRARLGLPTAPGCAAGREPSGRSDCDPARRRHPERSAPAVPERLASIPGDIVVVLRMPSSSRSRRIGRSGKDWSRSEPFVLPDDPA